MKSAVCDANILIDLLQADLLPAFINLGYKNHAPPGVIDEIKEDRSYVLKDAIETEQILVPVLKDLTEIIKFTKKYQPLSFQDCSCLYLAIETKSMLLTGEKLLRIIAESDFGLEVHGSLFIFDELIKKRLITVRMAHEKLKRLISSGTYLPFDEYKNRLRSWKRRF